MSELNFINNYKEIRRKFMPRPQVIHRRNDALVLETIEANEKPKEKPKSRKWRLKFDKKGKLRDYIFLNSKECIVLGEDYKPPGPRSALDIIRQVAFENDTTVAEICGTSRCNIITKARRILAYRLYKELGWAKARIGRYINKDHTTIIHAIRMREKELEQIKEAC